MDASTGVKLCECGCGCPTRIARWSDKTRGQIGGQPMRFIKGHVHRGKHREKHWNWKGGSFVQDGYVMIRQPDGTYVGEHVLVAEHALGHPLPAGVQVHHVNEIRSENRGSNLVICENYSYHMILHQRAKAFKATGSATAIHCTFCKKWGEPEKDDMHKRKTGGSYHRVCGIEYMRNYKQSKKQAREKAGEAFPY